MGMNIYEVDEPGSIIVITGPMFSGKSDELIRQLERCSFRRIKSLVFKPAMDNRWDASKRIVARTQRSVEAIPVDKVQEVRDVLNDPQNAAVRVVAFDELHFFNEDFFDLLIEIANSGRSVISAGLDQDFNGEPFALVAKLLGAAEIVHKLTAVCVICGESATMSYRKEEKGPRIRIGDKELYEARCRRCHRRGEVAENASEIPVSEHLKVETTNHY